MKIGSRKLSLAFASLAVGGILGAMGIHYGRELVGVAAIITSILGSTGAAFAVGNWGEWQARAKDSASIPEQLRAQGGN